MSEESAWFTSYLIEQSQCVYINGKVSKPIFIYCGVPQGSILGPLLFIIHVNDFGNSFENKIHSKQHETSSVRDEVEHIPERMTMNKLSQIIPKTELVHFLNWKVGNLVFKKTEITRTQYVKDLGMLLDKNLTYVFHVQPVLSELAKHISVINRLRHFTSSSVMIK